MSASPSLALAPPRSASFSIGWTTRRPRGLIEAAWDGGVRYFDTSPWYGRGLAEHTLGRALYRRPRADFTISTKIGRVLRRPLGPNAIKDQWLGGLQFQTVFDYGYDGVMRSFEDSLQRLGSIRSTFC